MTTPNNRAKLPFHILVKPAGPACNLRCDYCFYLEKSELYPAAEQTGTIMQPDTLELLLEQIILSQPAGVREIQIGWQGGEPTLCGLPFFEKAVDIQKRITPPGIKVTNAFQTNGILIDGDWARFFKENRFLIGLSLDGTQRLHDRFRRDRGGKGTHAQVMAALELLRSNNVEFNTLTCVQSDNADHPEEIYSFLKDAGSNFMQFIPIVEPLDGGRVSSRTLGAGQWGRFMSKIFDLWRADDIGKIFIQQFDSVLGGYMGHPGGVCVFNKYCGRSLAAEHNGDIYSCDHFVSPGHFLGNINEKPLADMVDSPEQLKFGADKFDSLPKQCLQCRYLRLCFGECPKNRIKKSASGEAGLNRLCSGYKDFFSCSEPVFRAMAEALQKGMPASEYMRFIPAPGRNDPCPCGSGRKFKHCHGRQNSGPNKKTPGSP